MELEASGKAKLGLASPVGLSWSAFGRLVFLVPESHLTTAIFRGLLSFLGRDRNWCGQIQALLCVDDRAWGAQVLDRLQQVPFAIAGQSLGGALTLLLAHRVQSNGGVTTLLNTIILLKLL